MPRPWRNCGLALRRKKLLPTGRTTSPHTKRRGGNISCISSKCESGGDSVRRWICAVLALLFISCATYLGIILWQAPVDSGPNPVPFLWGLVAFLVVAALIALRFALKRP